jgi:heme A synthase
MREMLTRHFDVVVVIWVLALVIGWSLIALSRAPLSSDQWLSVPAGPIWVVPSSDTNTLP